HYVGILGSEEFWTALQVTLLFTALGVAIVVVLATLIALLLNEPFPTRGLVRTLVLIPWAIPPVVNGLMWQWIYDAKVGALNGLLVSLGLVEQLKLDQPQAQGDQADGIRIGSPEAEVEAVERREVRLPDERGGRRAGPAGGSRAIVAGSPIRPAPSSPS